MPPSAATISETCPMAGFAESPEKPSDPPHCRPSVSFESGAGCRVNLVRLHHPQKRFRGWPCSASPLRKRSSAAQKSRHGFLKFGSRRLISSSSMGTCACWQPRLRTVAPGNIRMVNVTRQKAAKISGVFVRPAAAGLVQEKLDAVDVLKNFRRSAGSLRFRRKRPSSVRPISLRDRAAPAPQPGFGKSAAPQNPILLQTPALRRPDCGSRKRQAEARASNCACQPGHRLCDIREMFCPPMRKHPEESNRGPVDSVS